MKPNILYILKHKRINRFYKIGITSDLQRRMKQLETASPFGIEVVATFHIDNARKYEKALHRHLSYYHCNGEWFELSEEQIQKLIQDMESKIKNKEVI